MSGNQKARTRHLDICDCRGHRFGDCAGVHPAKCCVTCPRCGDRIVVGRYAAHEQLRCPLREQRRSA